MSTEYTIRESQGYVEVCTRLYNVKQSDMDLSPFNLTVSLGFSQGNPSTVVVSTIVCASGNKNPAVPSRLSTQHTCVYGSTLLNNPCVDVHAVSHSAGVDIVWSEMMVC